MLNYGQLERTFRKQAKNHGGKIPKAILEAPELTPGLEFYYSAFWDLNSCRTVGMGVSAIPWTAVIEYAKSCDLSHEETQDFVQIIKSMDRAYLEYNSGEMEKARKRK